MSTEYVQNLESTTLQNTRTVSPEDPQKGVRIVKHGNWSFEYSSRQNMFKTDIESVDKGVFEKVPSASTDSKTGAYLSEADLEDFRRGALIHKIARKKALSMLYAGGKLADLVDAVEDIILRMCKQDPKTYYRAGSPKTNMSGLAFPVGVNINNIVAHDSKIGSHTGKRDTRVFFEGDVVKVDIGVHVNGRIIDSAFTHIVTKQPGVHDSSNIYNNVLEASRDSVFNAIKMAGPEQRLDEMSECIDEIIRSYEVDMAGEALPIRPVKGIGGHNIKRYQIHGGKLILSEPDYDIQGDTKMEEDEVYAIETYATTGVGVMTQNSELNATTHFMEASKEDIEQNKAITKRDKKFFRATEFYNWLQTRNGLPFSSAWIDTRSVPKVEKAFKLGIPSGQLLAYPPLFDENNSVVAQFEHTIHVNSNSVEIFSLGDDY